MKLFLLIFLSPFFLSAAHANSCMTPAQVRLSFNNCAQFLKLTPARQQKAVKGFPQSLAEVRRACEFQKQKGLSFMLENERKYCRAVNSGGYERTGRSSPYQEKSPVCTFSSDCRGGTCSALNVCRDGGSRAACDHSNQCASGTCRIDGTCK
jgi:hypothetical protein